MTDRELLERALGVAQQAIFVFKDIADTIPGAKIKALDSEEHGVLLMVEVPPDMLIQASPAPESTARTDQETIEQLKSDIEAHKAKNRCNAGCTTPASCYRCWKSQGEPMLDHWTTGKPFGAKR